MKVLKLESKGKEVEDLQKYLKIKVDGGSGCDAKPILSCGARVVIETTSEINIIS